MPFLVDLDCHSYPRGKDVVQVLGMDVNLFFLVQPIGRASFFPKEKKSDDPPTAALESRLYKYKGSQAILCGHACTLHNCAGNLGFACDCVSEIVLQSFTHAETATISLLATE